MVEERETVVSGKVYLLPELRERYEFLHGRLLADELGGGVAGGVSRSGAVAAGAGGERLEDLGRRERAPGDQIQQRDGAVSTVADETYAERDGDDRR